MRLKTFTTHTLAIMKEVNAIENAFNIWASENKDTRIVRTDYHINKRENTHGLPYEELTLFVWYEWEITNKPS